ncbi:MAG: ABC transporter ATP-binding protein [Bdellovibrionaceae bacterium]|nr:ABC transporter ATP-binding protein [Pseudobdellovibrionaceae bacterium]
MSAVSIRDLKFRYHDDGPLILDISSFDVQTGEKVFLLGPSGSGKSTFLEVVSGVLPAKAGKLEVCGHDLTKKSAHERDVLRGSHIGYIFQSFNLVPYLSVQENIELPLLLNQERARRLKKDRVTEMKRLADHLEIGPYLTRPVSQLSVGQQQRVAACRALLGSPELILADEPTSALDQEVREKFIRLLFECCDETKAAVLFVSHDRTLIPLFDREFALPKRGGEGW